MEDNTGFLSVFCPNVSNGLPHASVFTLKIMVPFLTFSDKNAGNNLSSRHDMYSFFTN